MSRAVRCTPLVVLVLAALVRAGPRDDRLALEALLDRVEARRGVHHRSLVVVPLVLRDGVAAADGPRLAGPGIAISTLGDPDRDHTVRLVRSPAVEEEGVAGPAVLLPAGILLQGGPRERILSRPVLIAPGETVDVVARACDATEGVDPGGSGDARHVGSLAPLEVRRVDLLYQDEEALADVQKIDAILAGLPESAGSVRAVLGAESLKDVVRATMEQLGKIPGAYAGATVGHVAFLGYRPVEVYLAASPATYRSLAPTALRSLAVGAATWEIYVGRSGLPVEEPDWTRLPRDAARVLERSAGPASTRRRFRTGRRETGGGRTLLVLGPAPDPALDERSRPVGRLLLDDEGVAVLLESYPSGADRVFPSALTEPGGRPTDSRPDVRSGALTKAFLERLRERRAALRAALGIR